MQYYIVADNVPAQTLQQQQQRKKRKKFSKQRPVIATVNMWIFFNAKYINSYIAY